MHACTPPPARRQLLSSLTRMLSPHAGLALYASELQPRLLTTADAFYAAEGLRAAAALDVPQFLAHAEELLLAELERVHACLDAGTSLRPLRAISEQRLIAAHSASLLDRGFNQLLDACRTGDLRRLYELLSRVRQTEELRRRFAAQTRARVVDLVAEKDDEKDKRIVAGLLEYRASMTRCAAAAGWVQTRSHVDRCARARQLPRDDRLLSVPLQAHFICILWGRHVFDCAEGIIRGGSQLAGEQARRADRCVRVCMRACVRACAPHVGVAQAPALHVATESPVPPPLDLHRSQVRGRADARRLKERRGVSARKLQLGLAGGGQWQCRWLHRDCLYRRCSLGGRAGCAA